jgi:hypothetical protein
MLVEPPQPETNYRFAVVGYRLDSKRRYLPIEPDEQRRILSETTGLLFAISPEGDRVLLFDAETGEELLPGSIEKEGRIAAEERAERETARAQQEAQARKAAEELAIQIEAENARLREELKRLKGGN